MITWASVDLPEPLGPITAWTWPLSTSRFTPRRISLPPTEARSSDTTSLLTSGDLHKDVAVLDLDVVDGHRLGGGQRLRLAGEQGERAAVLPALDLSLLL